MASKKTARSQRHAQQQRDYLRYYGYPSAAELRREAQGLAHASVPTVRSVRRPYQRQLQSTRDFLGAVNQALADTSAGVGQGYDSAIAQSRAVDQAAQQRLAGLGLTGADAASAQAVTGALGDSATQNLISNAASAKGYAAQLPAIAAGQATQQRASITKQMLDALANRRDSLSQAFFQALNQVQSQHLQMAGFNQQADQFSQQMAQSQAQMAESIREFNTSQATSNRQFSEQMAYNYATLGARYGGSGGGKSGARNNAKAIAAAMGLTPNEVMGKVSDATKLLLGTGPTIDRVPVYDANGHIKSYKNVARQGSGAAGAVDAGVPFPTAIAQLVKNGVDPRIATYAATQIYRSAQGTNYTAWRTFVAWMAHHGSTKYNRLLAKQNVHRDFPGM